MSIEIVAGGRHSFPQPLPCPLQFLQGQINLFFHELSSLFSAPVA